MDIPHYMTVEEIRIAMLDNDCIGMSVRTHTKQLAIDQSWGTERFATILVI